MSYCIFVSLRSEIKRKSKLKILNRTHVNYFFFNKYYQKLSKYFLIPKNNLLNIEHTLINERSK